MSWFAPFWSCLKLSKEFLPASAPKFICNVLNSPPPPSTAVIWCFERSRRWDHNFWLHCQQIWRWNGSFASTKVSMVSGLEFTIASPSIIKVFRSSSFKLDPWVLSSDPNTALAYLFGAPKFHQSDSQLVDSSFRLSNHYPNSARIF